METKSASTQPDILKKLRLLIVDDEHSIRTSVSRLLAEDFDIETAQAFNEGSGKFLSFLPEIVLADYYLPDQNGLELLKSISQLAPQTVRVLISGHLEWSVIQPAFEKNLIHACFLKPWDNEAFKLQILQASQLTRILQENQLLQNQAVTDPVTNLRNFRFFESYFQTELERAKRHSRNLTLFMIDIDHFKKFNDKMGHPEGNLALFKISRLLEKNLRTFDTVCRYGGEEFAVILPDTDVNNSKIVAERLRQAVELECKKMNQPLTVSLGISNYPLHGSTATEVISCADKALYLAKSRGKNQFALLEALS